MPVERPSITLGSNPELAVRSSRSILGLVIAMVLAPYACYGTLLQKVVVFVGLHERLPIGHVIRYFTPVKVVLLRERT
jgi:hypothetical protein